MFLLILYVSCIWLWLVVSRIQRPASSTQALGHRYTFFVVFRSECANTYMHSLQYFVYLNETQTEHRLFNINFAFYSFLCVFFSLSLLSFHAIYIWSDSFVQEFVASPLDGVSQLLDVLRLIQLSQQSGIGQTNTTGKLNAQTYQRRALLDELACLYVSRSKHHFYFSFYLLFYIHKYY